MLITECQMKLYMCLFCGCNLLYMYTLMCAEFFWTISVPIDVPVLVYTNQVSLSTEKSEFAIQQYSLLFVMSVV